jgi:hypothetical protein
VAEGSVHQPQVPIPLAVRLPLAAGLVAWGARTGRTWTLPASAALALPVLWLAGFSILAAIPALRRPALAPRTAPTNATGPRMGLGGAPA